MSRIVLLSLTFSLTIGCGLRSGGNNKDPDDGSTDLRDNNLDPTAVSPDLQLEGEPCSDGSQCGFGKLCNLDIGICVSCITDDHCVHPSVCRLDRTCGEFDGCRDFFDCNPGVCNADTNLCVACDEEFLCPDGHSCREQECISDAEAGIPCTGPTDCEPFGKTCDQDTALCRNCLNNAECGAGRTCSAGTCTGNGSGTGGIALSQGSCPEQQVQCISSECIHETFQCDSINDCDDYSDETQCGGNGNAACDFGEWLCTNGSDCVTKTWRCDGVSDCNDDSDEAGCGAGTCTSSQWQCPATGACIVDYYLCDAFDDCGDNTDEDGCGQ